MKRLSFKTTLLIATGVLMLCLSGVLVGLTMWQSVQAGHEQALERQRLALSLVTDRFAMADEGIRQQKTSGGGSHVVWDGIPEIPDQGAVDRVSALTGTKMSLMAFDPGSGEFTRVATSLRNPDGSSANGTKLAHDNPAYAALIAKQEFKGLVDLVGAPYQALYDPILSSSGQLVGAFAVLLDSTAFNEIVYSDMLVTTEAALVLVAASLGALVWLLSRLFRPLGDLGEALKRMEAGDLDTGVRYVDRQDEIGVIASRAESFRIGLQQARQTDIEARRQQEDASRVVQDLRAGLGRLAAGDLTLPLDQAFPAQYEELRSDFNATLDTLSTLIGSVVQNAATIRGRVSEINSASENLSRRTENQAATLEETAAALDELTTSVRSAASSAGEVETVVRSARGEAEDSGRVVSDATLAMAEIKKSSDKINQIISVIDDIAFQTNLLALNAGVEAARAGDAGRGFAVVASEVRALAQRSSEAAKEIKILIGVSTEQVTTGVGLVNRTGEALSDIVRRVAHIADLMSGIASGAQEQSSGLGEINLGVIQLDQVTQQNAAMVEEVTAASGTLREEAENLENLVARFELPGAQRRVTSIAGATRPTTPARLTASRAGAAAGSNGTASRRKVANGAEWQDF